MGLLSQLTAVSNLMGLSNLRSVHTHNMSIVTVCCNVSAGCRKFLERVNKHCASFMRMVMSDCWIIEAE